MPHVSDHPPACSCFTSRHDHASTVTLPGAPSLPGETEDLVNNVVFPTALHVRDAGRIDVYYRMAGSRIGVGKLQVPQELPTREDPLLARLA